MMSRRRAQRSNRWGLLWVCVGLAIPSTGCSDAIDPPNRQPQITIDAIEGDGAVVEVFYQLADGDGDDVRIEIVYCDGGRCVQPTESPGGDGTRNLPTLRQGAPVLHLYRWAATCDVADGGLSLTVRIEPNDGESTGTEVESAPFSLGALGVSGDCSVE